MISRIKKIILNLTAGANIMTVVLMILVGYSDHLSPEKYPLLGCVGMSFPFIVLLNLLFVPVWVLFSWRRLLIPVVGFLLAFIPIRTYMPLRVQSEPPEGCIRIVSYNVCCYGGNYKYEEGFDTVFNYLKRLRPDIVCVQEDITDKTPDYMARYATFFRYNDTTCISNSAKVKNCVGIHTNYPILRKEKIPYESPTNGSVAYFLQIDGDTVIVINNHLESSHLSTDDRTRYQNMLKGSMERDTAQAETILLMGKLNQGMAVRAGQVDIVHQYVEAHKQYPLIVCGDFNDTPISYARHTMAKGLTDCFVESGRGLGLSFNRKGFNLRIDHMMCSSHFTPYQCEIDDKMDASDHFPLLCWLKKGEKP